MFFSARRQYALFNSAMKNLTVFIVLWMMMSFHCHLVRSCFPSRGGTPKEISTVKPVPRPVKTSSSSVMISTTTTTPTTFGEHSTSRQLSDTDEKKEQPKSSEAPLDTATIVAVSITLGTLLVAAFSTAFILKYCCTRDELHRKYNPHQYHAHSINKTLDSQTSMYQSIVHHHPSGSNGATDGNLIYTEVEIVAPPSSVATKSNGTNSRNEMNEDSIVYSEIIVRPSFHA